MLHLANPTTGLDRWEGAAPRRIGRAADILLWLVVGLVVAAILWAAIGQVDQTTRAPGRVRTDAEKQIVSNLEGGVVLAVMVRPGETVKKGQPLLRLDPTQTSSDLGGNRSQIAALRAKVARLTAEVTGQAPVWADNGPEAEIERHLYSARRAELSGSGGASSARVVEAARAVTEAAATLESRRAALSAANAQLAMLQPLVTRGIEPRASLMQAQRDASVAASEVSAAAASLGRMQAAVAEAQSSAGRDRGQWRSQAAADLALARAELETRERTLPALQDKVDRTIIRAPRGGRIDRLLAGTVGGTVRAGEPLVEIVPDDDALVVEAMVRPQDIGHVRTGQPANVSITAYDPAIHGSLPGRVLTISPDAQVDQRTGESHYVIRVRTDRSSLLAGDGTPLPIGTGMVADVSLLGEKRSVLSYLLTPITRLRDSALRE